MKNRTVQVHEPRPQLPSRVAWVNEPNVRECRPSARWRLLFLQLRMTGRFEIEIQFVTRDNHRGMLRIDNSRRADVDWIGACWSRGTHACRTTRSRRSVSLSAWSAARLQMLSSPAPRQAGATARRAS